MNDDTAATTPFEYPTTIRLHHTDAAGVLYYAQQFHIAHEAFEAWMKARGIPIGPMIYRAKYGLPVVHTEADYGAPLRLGDDVSVTVEGLNVGESSFMVRCVLHDSGGEPVGTVTTTHVAVDRRTREKIPLPGVIRRALVGPAPTPPDDLD